VIRSADDDVMPFRDVIGHRRLIDLVARSIERDSLPPSLILSGPRGVGKRLVATAMAQAFNCLGPRWGTTASPPAVTTGPGDIRDACGTCAACTRIARGMHPDVLVVEPGDTGSIKVDEVREVVDRAAYRPFEGRRRVVVIDDADALVATAQNALLKTLEEPAPSSVFLLVTARPDALLATVRSRCPRLRFWPLQADEVVAILKRLGRTEAEARALSVTAGGSVAAALEADAGTLGGQREVAVRVLAQAAASDDPARRLDSAKHLLAGTGGGASDRAQLASGLRVMASLLRDVAVLGTGADRRALANPDAVPALEPLSAFHGERGVRAFGSVDQAISALERNASVKIVADWLALRL
jgi:DNA polymerase-3 subunit delta'